MMVDTPSSMRHRNIALHVTQQQQQQAKLVSDMEFESTFTTKQVKHLFDIWREKKFRMEHESDGSTTGNNSTSRSDEVRDKMFNEFCEKHQLDRKVLDDIAKYVNSPYLVWATKNNAFAFWHKPNLKNNLWK